MGSATWADVKRAASRRMHSVRRDGAFMCFRCDEHTVHLRAPCAWKHCTEYYCAQCRRYSFGLGQVGCPCDWGTNISGARGHHTRAEQPRPSPPHKLSVYRPRRWRTR